MTSAIIIKLNVAIECANGQHEFEKINDGNVRCKKCGRFAKVGHLHFDNRRKEK